MTEERMIRVTEYDIMYWGDDRESVFVEGTFVLEPAPPKNWEEIVAEYETKLAELRFQIGRMQMDINALKERE